MRHTEILSSPCLCGRGISAFLRLTNLLQLQELPIADSVQNTAEHYTQKQEETRIRFIVGEAVDEAEEAGVPRTALDTSSPDAVRRSVEKYQSDQRIRTLEEQIADMRKGSDKLRETAATARTQERQRLGATQVLTSTGEMPPLPTEQSEEIDRLEHEKAEAKRHKDGALVMAIDRQIRQLRAQ